MKAELNTRKFFNCLAFISIVFAAVALLVSKILGWVGFVSDVTSILTQIANALAYVTTSIAAYYYVRTKRSIVWLIIYIIAVVIVAAMLIIPVFVK